MTEQEQQIAIAEACGWTRFEFGPYDDAPFGWPPGLVNCDKIRVPDYPHDLNASVEFEQVIVCRDLWRQYVEHLRKITGHQDPIDASAAARLQAALRTLNLWKD